MLMIPDGTLAYGTQLAIQSQSSLYVADWEREAGPDDLALIARAADAAGFFYVAVCDHIAIPRDKADAMGLWWQDTFTTLGFLAAQTERCALLSHVYVLAYRHALVAAKGYETLDFLSGGRAIAGIGAGHVEAEFDTLGVPFAERGRITDELLPRLAEALENTYVGDMGACPRPVQTPRPPIWIGGSGKPALRRAARYEGWLPQGPATDESIAYIREQRDAAGRAGEPFAFGHVLLPFLHVVEGAEVREGDISGSPTQIAEAIAANTPAGVNQLQVRFRATSARHMADQISAFGETVAPLLAVQ
ncbi:MAG: LLM class flavin-dependent oxidoreductase [Acidimicrobiales bacterium]|jgi:alkanesulfonate monooxygenase SsuD/methylene tetrahydromethanopterin reductase-like flavin-dependent oxidoreductase (luciferase family)|nr:LLM class flavin-dependent oxidoreductase [Acidimicrobiales bacterium]